jgi:amino acid transporter
MTELRRTLGLWHGVGLYVGAVLGTGVLVLPAIAADTAGPASVLVWLGLVVLSAPLALTYAALARQRPDAGGFSDAIERAFGPRAGAVAGWLFLAQVPTGTTIVALIAGDYAASCLGRGPEVGRLLGGALVLAAYAVNFAGLRVSAAAQLATLGIIAAGIVFIVGRSLPAVEASAFTPFMPCKISHFPTTSSPSRLAQPSYARCTSSKPRRRSSPLTRCARAGRPATSTSAGLKISTPTPRRCRCTNSPSSARFVSCRLAADRRSPSSASNRRP